LMLAVALISTWGGNRHTCVRGLVKYDRLPQAPQAPEA
jgi:hypothetical protein